MAWSVTESVLPWSQPQTGASRSYIVSSDATTDVRSPIVARQQLETYLATQAERYNADGSTTGLVFTIGDVDVGSPTGGQFDVSLIQALHGYPVRDAEVEEVEGTDGAFYTATVNYGQADDLQTASANETTVNLLAGGTGATVQVTYQRQAQLRARPVEISRDVLILRHANPDYDVPAEPPYEIGAVNVTRTSSGQVVTRGANVSSPPVSTSVNFSISGAAVRGDWVRDIMAAADKGVLNSLPFTIAGITYPGGSVLFNQANVSVAANGTTQVNCGFSIAAVRTLTFDGSNADASIDLAGDIFPTRLAGDNNQKFVFDRYYEGSGFTFTTPGNTITYSDHDYYAPYIEQVTGDDGTVSNQVHFINIHRIFEVENFGVNGLFGADAI